MHGWSKNVILLFVVTLTWAVVGCGNPSGRIPIQGIVTYKDKPLAKGMITFSSKDNTGQTTEAASIIEGKYTSKKGLLPGTYRVEITAIDEPQESPNTPPGAPKRDRKELIPEEYNRNSKLSIEVSETGSRDFPFDLK